MKQYLEVEIISKIEKLLGENYSVNAAIPDYDLGYQPDGIIYFKRQPIAVFDIKRLETKLAPRFIDYIYRLNEYNKNKHLSYAFFTDGKRAVLINDNIIKTLNKVDSVYKYAISLSGLLDIIKSNIKIRQASEDESIKLKKSIIDSANDTLLSRTNKRTGKVKRISKSIIKKREDFLKYLEGLSDNYISKHVHKSNSIIYMDDDFERDFFLHLLGEYKKDNICRYTSLSSTIRIIRERKASVCSITCMNDKSECYYADQKLNGANGELLLSNLPLYETEELNRYMIMSCSDISLKDKLTMWRMYGDDAKGICFEYSIDKEIMQDRGFYLARVSYAESDGTHPSLDFIKRCLNITINNCKFQFRNFNIWKHFFKPYDYIDEQEVRLLYQCKKGDENNYKWIVTGDQIISPVMEFDIGNGNNKFPLIINQLILGPKSPEKHTNAPELNLFANSQNIFSHIGKINVELSKIENYR